MVGDDRKSEVFDLSSISEKLLADAMKLSAVVHDRLQTIVELGALPHDEEQFAGVAEHMRQVTDLGVVAVRSIAETDFTVRDKPKLDITSDDAFEQVCEFISAKGDSAFSAADLREFLISQGADETTVAKKPVRYLQSGEHALSKWRRNRV